jgi:hypothetical protein
LPIDSAPAGIAHVTGLSSLPATYNVRRTLAAAVALAPPRDADGASMSSHRQPGPEGTTGQSADLNDGTLARTSSPHPGHLRSSDSSTRLRTGIPAAPDRAASTAAGAAGDESRTIDTLRVRQGAVFLDGSRYRLVRLQDWAGLRNDERFERVKHDASVGMLMAESRRADVSLAERSAFETAARLLAGDRANDRDGGLLLVRVLRLRAPRQGTEDSTVTPSQLAAATAEEVSSDAVTEEHWIGLQLQWDDGRPIDGAAYVIIGPDGRKFAGVTDTQGQALVVGLRSGGQCRISFPGLDRSSLTSA